LGVSAFAQGKPAAPASDKPAAAPAASGDKAATAPAAAPDAKPSPAGSTAAAATASAAPSATPPPSAPAAPPYAIRLSEVERRTNELKEQVFRSKARLNLLKETVLHGVIAGARATIIHKNEMGYTFTPVRYVYALDGAEIFARSDDTGKLGQQKEMEIFNGSIIPGNHTLSVQMVYQGNGLPFLKG